MHRPAPGIQTVSQKNADSFCVRDRSVVIKKIRLSYLICPDLQALHTTASLIAKTQYNSVIAFVQTPQFQNSSFRIPRWLGNSCTHCPPPHREWKCRRGPDQQQQREHDVPGDGHHVALPPEAAGPRVEEAPREGRCGAVGVGVRPSQTCTPAHPPPQSGKLVCSAGNPDSSKVGP